MKKSGLILATWCLVVASQSRAEAPAPIEVCKLTFKGGAGDAFMINLVLNPPQPRQLGGGVIESTRQFAKMGDSITFLHDWKITDAGTAEFKELRPPNRKRFVEIKHAKTGRTHRLPQGVEVEVAANGKAVAVQPTKKNSPGDSSTKQLSFHVVSEKASDSTVERDHNGEKLHLVEPAAIAQPSIRSASTILRQPGGVVVSLEFEESTAKAIHLLTKDNVGKRLAVVISDRVIMAPVIRGAIPNGKLEISGMSREEAVAFVSEIERPPGKSPAIRKR